MASEASDRGHSASERAADASEPGGPPQRRPWALGRPTERVAVAVLMLLIAVPLSIYARIAIDASRAIKEAQALDRNQFAAELGARLLERDGTAALPAEAGGLREDGLRLWVADPSGAVLYPADITRGLGGYAPFRLAATGGRGAVRDYAPWDHKPAIVGYARTHQGGPIVLAIQPRSTVFASDALLIRLLSFLLAPVLALLFPTVWFLVGMYQRERDITRQLAEHNEALRRVDHARADFLASVSHDLRTPLAAMQLSLTGILDGPGPLDDERVRSTLHGATEEVDRLSARVRNLLDMARLEAEAGPRHVEVCDLTDIVATALDRVRPMTEGRPIAAAFPEHPLLVECDHAQVETVLINLLENALKYSPPGSSLDLRGEDGSGEVILSVRDRGDGVHPGDEERVFQRFYRAPTAQATTGTGLGLAICRTVIERHGGRIGVRSAPGGGAEFWFTLPAFCADGVRCTDDEMGQEEATV